MAANKNEGRREPRTRWHLESEPFQEGEHDFPFMGAMMVVEVDQEDGSVRGRVPVGFMIQGVFVPLGRP